VTIDKIIKQAHFIDVATPNGLTLDGKINEKLPKSKDEKKGIWKMKKACMTPLAPLAPLAQRNYTKA